MWQADPTLESGVPLFRREKSRRRNFERTGMAWRLLLLKSVTLLCPGSSHGISIEFPLHHVPLGANARTAPLSHLLEPWTGDQDPGSADRNLRAQR
jgi:hypothetical protein